ACTARATLPADTGIVWNRDPAQVAELCKSELAKVRGRIREIDAQPSPVGFAQGVGAVEDANAAMLDALLAQTEMADLAVDKGVRDASRACRDETEAFGNELSADPLVLKIAQSSQAAATNEADRALADHYVESGRRAGAGLTPAKRKQVTAL